jgi:DUF4097 and DUF4098 domain-containing protein YvlB
VTRYTVLACLTLVGCTCTCTPFSFSSHSSFSDGHVAIVNGVRLTHRRRLSASSERAPGRLDLTFGTADLTVIGVPGATTATAEAELFEKEPGDAECVFTETGVALKSRGDSPIHLQSLTLRVPAATPVALKTSMGDIHLSGLAGIPFIRLHVSSGDIDLRELADVACLEATSSMGNVTLTGSRGIARTTLETSSGDVSVEKLERSGDLIVKTGMGDITLESLRIPSADLTASMGDIRVLGSDVDHLKAQTSSGDIDCRTSTYRSREFKTGMGEVREGRSP